MSDGLCTNDEDGCVHTVPLKVRLNVGRSWGLLKLHWGRKSGIDVVHLIWDNFEQVMWGVLA